MWDKLSEEQQIWFKQLALGYRQTDAHRLQRLGYTPTNGEFLGAVLGNEETAAEARDRFRTGATKMIRK